HAVGLWSRTTPLSRACPTAKVFAAEDRLADGMQNHCKEEFVPESAKNWIVETDWLAAHLDAPDLIIFDASWHLPNSGRDAKAEYMAEHIPGARFFDIDDLVDETSPLPHMLPPTPKFASRMKKMGVGDGMRIVVYDTYGL